MTMHKALHLRNDIKLICQEKKEEEGLTSTEGSVDATIQRLKEYTKISKERLISVADNNSSNRINIKINRKTTTKISRKQNRKKNNCMDTSSNKLSKLHMKWLGHIYAEETAKRNWICINCSTK